ncbi:MAG: hypothetical protein L3J24_08060 [Xanthomonadales bacterium]|nr:hypothetical protein [Xanthomonadales bacterium]
MDKVILAFIVGLAIFAVNSVRAQNLAVEESNRTIENKTLQVLRISDRWIWLDAVDYGWKRFKIPDDFSFIVDSEAVSLDEIVVGQKLNVYITRTETDWILLSEPGGVEAVEDTNAGEEESPAMPTITMSEVVITSTVPNIYIMSTGTTLVPISEVDGTRAVEDTEVDKCIVIPQESLKCHKRRDR